MLLTPDELHELTDCPRKGDQIAWLTARSWVFEIGDTGRPKVDREEYERHMIGPEESERELAMQRWIRSDEARAAGLEVRNERWRKRLLVYPLDQLRGLARVSWNTKASGVYFLWIGPMLWYIGQANIIGPRIQQHANNGKTFTHATYLPAHKDWKKDIEADHVGRYHPRDNRTSNG